MKTIKNSFTWKRGLCAAVACLLLGLTACNAKTPAETVAAPAAGNVETGAPVETVAAPAAGNVETGAPAETVAAPAAGNVETSAPAETQPVSAPAVETTVSGDSIVETDLADVLAWMEKDDAERAKLSGTWVRAYGGQTRIQEIDQVGDRYQAKVVRTVAVTASEEEMEKARQTGRIVLQGTEYRYTNSQQEFDNWLKEWGLDGFAEEVPKDGIILEDKAELSYNDLCGSFYWVSKVGDVYIFYFAVGGVTRRLQEPAEEVWIWLDGDMRLYESPARSEDPPEGGYTLASYLQNHSISDKRCRFSNYENEPCILVDIR